MTQRQPDHDYPEQALAGTPLLDLCRDKGTSVGSFYKWLAKFDGMDASINSRLKELEDENRRLKKMYAEVQFQADIPSELLHAGCSP